MTLPEPFDLGELCEMVSAHRGRPVHVRGLPGPAARARPHGLWIAAADDDWIFVEPVTSPLHWQHIVLHELAHMICCHPAAELPEIAMMTRLFPDLSPGTVRAVLGRTSYQSDCEREAETLASLILLATARPAASPGLPVMPVRDTTGPEMLILRRACLALGAFG